MSVSALIFSKMAVTRLSHDLAGVAGAVSNSLELLAEGEAIDQETMALAENSASTLVSRLAFFRAAYGNDGPITGEKTANQIIRKYLDTIENSFVRYSYEWQADAGLPLHCFRFVLLGVQIVAECLIKGGDISVSSSQADKTIRITGTGVRIILDKGIEDSFAGKESELSPKEVNALFLTAAAAEKGYGIRIEQNEGRIDLILYAKGSAF